jgi:hypothetical protein
MKPLMVIAINNSLYFPYKHSRTGEERERERGGEKEKDKLSSKRRKKIFKMINYSISIE